MDHQNAVPTPLSQNEKPAQNTKDNTQLNPPFFPTTWPGGFGAYKYSKAGIKQNIWAFLILVFLGFVISFVQLVPKYGDALYLLTLPIYIMATLGVTIVQLESIKGNKIEAEEAFKKSFKYVLNGIGLYFFTSIIIFFSILAFIIPFFFVMPRIYLATLFMIDRNLNFVDAVSVCWNETKGHSLKVWGIIGVAVAIGLLFLTIIGIPFSIYFIIMYSAANAVLYFYITNAARTAPSAAAPVGASGPSRLAPPTTPNPPITN